MMGFVGRQFYKGSGRYRQLSLLFLFGMSPNVELGGFLSDVLNSTRAVPAQSQVASLTVKTRFNSESASLPALAVSVTVWKKLESYAQQPSDLDLGVRLLLAKSVGPTRLYLNAGSLISDNMLFARNGDWLFGTGIEYSPGGACSFFAESVGRTKPSDDSQKLIDRYNLGARLMLLKDVHLRGVVGYDRRLESDNYTVNIALTIGNTAAPKQKPKIEYRPPTLTEFSSFLTLDEIRSKLRRDSAAAEEEEVVVEEKPRRLMIIPVDSSATAMQQSDSSGTVELVFVIDTILNACGQAGMAKNLRSKLTSLGHEVDHVVNAEDVGEQKTIVFYRPGSRESAESLAKLLGIAKTQIQEDTRKTEGIGLKIRIGCDLADLIKAIDSPARKTSEGDDVPGTEEE